MSYNPNSSEARKGALGEQIVKKFLERDGWHVQKPDGVSEDTPTQIDWLCTRGKKICCVEVKTYKKFLYSFNELPTFKIPLAKYEGYKAEAQKRGGSLELWFVNSEDGKIYRAASETLDKKFRRAGFDFPATITFDDGDTAVCFHVEQFTCQAVKADDLAKLRAIDSETNAPAEKQNRINRTAFKLPYYVPMSNGTALEFFATEGKAFVYLPQLRQADIDTDLIPKSKRYFIGNFPLAFAEVDELFEILSEEYDGLSDWWTANGRNDVYKRLDDFLTAQNFLREHLGIDLPDDWPKLKSKGDALVEYLTPQLEKIPACYLRKIGSSFHSVASSPQEKTAAGKISAKCYDVAEERPAPLKNAPVVVKLSKVAQKISEAQTPNDSTIEFFTVEGCEKIFVHGAQLAVACGYPNQSGTTSDNSDFSKAVTAVAKFYAIRCSETAAKARRFVDAEDVPEIVQEYFFNRMSRSERYNTAVEFLSWWNSGGVNLEKLAELASSTKQAQKISATQTDERPTLATADDVDVLEKINARAELLMKNFGALRREALIAAVKLTEQETGRDLSPLLELLK